MKLRTCRVDVMHQNCKWCFTDYQMQGCVYNKPKFFIVGEQQNARGEVAWYCLYHETLAGHNGNFEKEGEIRRKDLADAKKLIAEGGNHMWWVEIEMIKDIKEPQIMSENE